MGIEGRVFVKFVVELNGAISFPEIVKGINKECDEEALRVIGKAPKWKPASYQGRTVRQAFTLPLTFKLTDPVIKKK
jgi:protein TonB